MRPAIVLMALLVLTSVCFAAEAGNGICLTNGTYLKGTAKLHKPAFKSMYFMLGDTLQIPISKVKSFDDALGHHVKIININYIQDFADLQIEGKLNLYSNKVVVTNLLGTKIRKVIYYSLSNDQLYLVDYKGLRPILSQTPESSVYLDAYLSKMKTVNYIVGIGLVSALVAAGFAVADTDGSSVSPPCIGISLVSFFAAYKTKQRAPNVLIKGIHAYNNVP